MRGLVLLIAALFAATLVPLAAISQGSQAESQRENRKCDVGPVNKTYGGTEWLVYSCDDGRTVALVSAPGNPAMPFVFMFYERENAYRLYGEGAGKKEVTAAAFDELKALSKAEIAALIEQTKLSNRK